MGELNDHQPLPMGSYSGRKIRKLTAKQGDTTLIFLAKPKGRYTIICDKAFYVQGILKFDVYKEKNGEAYLWKSLVNWPVFLEYDDGKEEEL